MFCLVLLPRRLICVALNRDWRRTEGDYARIDSTARSFVGSLYLLIPGDLPLRQIWNGVWSDPLDGADPGWDEVETEWPQKSRDREFNRIVSSEKKTFSLEDAVKSFPVPLLVSFELVFSTFSPELQKIECKTIIKAVTEVKWEGKSVWPVYRGMVSCRPGSQTPQCCSHTERGVQYVCMSHKNQRSPVKHL